jgi:phosphatidate cytidylyltransferase
VSAQQTSPAPGVRALRFNAEWITRPLFGILLVLFALFVVSVRVEIFAVAIALGAALAAREWHRCVGAGETLNIENLITAATVALAEMILLYTHNFWMSAALVAAGSVAAFVVARPGNNPLWQSAGVLYLGFPALALLSLRAYPAHGVLIVIGLFLIVWSTDTGALVCGKVIGGPRIAPRLSPGKTWAGTIGGSVIAALVFAAYIGFLGGTAMVAALFAFVFSFTAHGGDLFESLVKRRFGLKDSGTVIPGHGGVLDRMDSTLASASVLALLVFVAHFSPLFGMH